ncbi:MAG: glycerophosphodiester phosphodiesterase [Lentimicrobiaceae bacterium]|nr:glycerophosphodiester phosphodiesterase [Lentimicrobiaceae bacterium]
MRRKASVLCAALFSAFMISSCETDNFADDTQDYKNVKVSELTPAMQTVRDYVPVNSVIAHRGSTFWVPEETEAAFRWARNIGADYMEADLQITKDGVILALHDYELKRTTDIENIFPDREYLPASSFTYEELMQLDAGSWFNDAKPEQARESFSSQKQYISTLEDMIMIAQGMRIKRDPVTQERIYTKVENADGTVKYTFEYEPDPMDNGNRPGIYIETKEPWVNPGIEQALYTELDRLGWNIMTQPETSAEQFYTDGAGKKKVNVGNTNGKVIIQTFSLESLRILNSIFAGKIPTCFLLWLGNGPTDMPTDDPRTYAEFINFGLENNAVFMGPSIAGAPNKYPELLKPWQSELIHKSGAAIHAYSFDTREQMGQYYGEYFYNNTGSSIPNRPLVDGMFTNRSEMTLNFYKEQGVRPVGAEGTALEILTQLGY